MPPENSVPTEPPQPPQAETPPQPYQPEPVQPTVPPTFAEQPVPPEPLAPPNPGMIISGDGGMAPPSPQDSPQALPQPDAPAPKTPRRFKKVLLPALLAVVIIGGGSAAAYFGVVVPNKPANVLKKAVENSWQNKPASFNGTLNYGGSGLSAKVSFKGAEDLVAKAIDIQANTTVSGVSLPIEARLVNKNAYIKVGDLSQLVSLANTFSPDLGSMAQKVNSQVANKWIVIDSTLLDESGASCILNANWSFTPADRKLLETQYDKQPFATIQSASNDTVNGKAAEKFQLSLDDDNGAKFSANTKDLSFIKALNKCYKNLNVSSVSTTADHGHTPITVWVDKSSKQIVQIATHSTSQDKKNGVAGDLTVQLSYGKVSISAPTGAIPAVQLLSSLQKSLNSGASSSNGSSIDLTQLFKQGSVQ